MRVSILFFIAVIFSGSCISCSKMLDMQSEDGRTSLDEVFSNYFKTQDYFSTITNSVLNVHMAYDGTALASFCDEAYDSSDNQGGSVTKWYKGNVSSTSNPVELNFWAHYFVAIQRCNTFLEYLHKPELENAQKEFDETTKTGWIAQVRVVRAYHYLQLIKRYGGVPLVKSLYEVDHDYSNEKRATFEECVDFIIEECRTALETPLPDNNNTGFNWFRNNGQRGGMSRGIACAVMSQASLYAASPLWFEEGSKYTWEYATTITKQSLDLCLANGYELYRNDNVAQNAAFNAYDYYFITRPTPDLSSAWEYETLIDTRDNRMDVWSLAGLPSTTGSTRAGACPTQEMVDAYEVFDGTTAYPLLDLERPYLDREHLVPNYDQDALAIYDPNDPYANRDPRFYGSIYFNGAVRDLNTMNRFVYTYVGAPEGITSSITEIRYTKTGYYMRKFNNWQSDVNSNQDGFQRLFRLAELYLNFAEAANEAHGPDYRVPTGVTGGASLSAKEAVDEIRDRVGMPALPEGMSKTQFALRCRNERKVELAFEEHRFFDVRRWKILDDTDVYRTGMRIIENGGNYSYVRFALNETPNPFSQDKYLMYPISQSEVSKMLQYTGRNWQNPGW